MMNYKMVKLTIAESILFRQFNLIFVKRHRIKSQGETLRKKGQSILLDSEYEENNQWR